MSEFKIRGFIEGFYGRVWSDEKRRKVLSLVAKKGMNAYFYAPKDDPFLRKQWRVVYDEASLAKFSSLLDFTSSLGVSLYYCLSPGLDICYSSDEDRKDLLNKYLSVHALGVRDFGLFLDDIPDRLIHDRDKESFSRVCDAHAHLINEVYAALPSGTSLTVCPMVYHGTGEEEYITRLCRGIPETVRVFWTGKKICSPELTESDALKFFRATGKRPLYWDNFPVNDAEMYGEMHIAPYLGRETGLYRSCEGIVVNVMEYPLCSAVSLLTVCDYLIAPENYAPEKSFREAVETVTGDGFEKWMPFLDHTRYSCQCDCFSEYLSDSLAAVESEITAGNGQNAVKMLTGLINEYLTCSETIKNNAQLSTELKKWIDRFDEITLILTAALTYVISGSEHDRLTLKNAMIKYNAGAIKLAGFGLREFAEFLIGEFTV